MPRAFLGVASGSPIRDPIGPFELSEYLGLAAIYGCLVTTTPFSLRSVFRRHER